MIRALVVMLITTLYYVPDVIKQIVLAIYPALLVVMLITTLYYVPDVIKQIVLAIYPARLC